MKKHNYPQRKSKYTSDVLQSISDCSSVDMAIERLGLKKHGGHKELRRKIKEVLISSGSYKGQAHRKGRPYLRVSDEDFFCKTTLKRSSTAVRDALFKRGYKEKKCESCGGVEWLGGKMPLEVHHIDGDKQNNEIVNLSILCPNCHTLTDTYKIKNKAT